MVFYVTRHSSFLEHLSTENRARLVFDEKGSGILVKMNKGYFQDILPKAGAHHPQAVRYDGDEREEERGIRAVHITHSEGGSVREDAGRGVRNPPYPPLPPQKPYRHRKSGLWLWLLGALVLAFAVAVGMLAFRPMQIVVMPHIQPVTLDAATPLVAYPASNAPEGSLTYTIESLSFEDTEPVQAGASAFVEEKAGGTLIVSNNYSAEPVRLIKNTRFETENGLVFRTPIEVVIPGKKASVPGEMSVAVVADASGDTYNVGPTSFTLPGLKSTPAMYRGVTARSTIAMSGGFKGERPSIAEADASLARAKIRDRLTQRVAEAIAAKNNTETAAFSDLAYVAFEPIPPTVDETGARLGERVRIELPLIAARPLAEALAANVSTETSGGVMLESEGNIRAERVAPAIIDPNSPLQFTLSGSGRLVWSVDTNAFAAALAGREVDAFRSIAESFPGISEARLRVPLLLRTTFPSDPTKIQITLGEETNTP
jgi:hypothetical protein